MNEFEVLAERISELKIFNTKDISIIIEVHFNIWKNDYLKTRNNLSKEEQRKLNVTERNRARLLDNTSDKVFLEKIYQALSKNYGKEGKDLFLNIANNLGLEVNNG